MADMICTCVCGHKFMVSEWAMGSERRCERCGKLVRVGSENTVSLAPPKELDERTEFAAISTADRQPLAGEQNCAKCGRAFRGAWDRYRLASGEMYCHRCAKQADAMEAMAGQMAPAQAAHETAPPPLPTEDEGLLPPPRRGLGEKFEEFRETPTFRTMLWCAAIGMIVLGLVLPFTDWARAPVSETPAAVEGPPQEAPPAHTAIYIAFRAGMSILPCFIALYIVLKMSDRLPSNRWYGNLLHVGLVALLLGPGSMLISMAIGAFLPIIGGLVSIGVLMYAIFVIYDLEIGDMILFIVMRFVIGLLLSPLTQLAGP